MINNLHKIIVISSLAKDILLYKDGTRRIRRGGPAFWISKTLNTLGLPQKMILARPPALVKIEMPKEKGMVVSVGKIRLPRNLRGDAIIVSTIGNELDLRDLKKLKGTIALDAQGFVRARRTKTLKFPSKVLDKIQILKATRSELKVISSTDVENQKHRILLVTKGRIGFEIFARSERYVLKSKKTKFPDTIGAGDVLLTAFTLKFLQARDPKAAGRFALDCVAKFLETKSKRISLKKVEKFMDALR